MKSKLHLGLLYFYRGWQVQFVYPKLEFEVSKKPGDKL